MDFTIDQMINELRTLGADATVSISARVDLENGATLRATGSLAFVPGTIVDYMHIPERLATAGHAPLAVQWAGPEAGAGEIPEASSPRPESATLDVSISRSIGPAVPPLGRFWLNGNEEGMVTVTMEERGNAFVGAGLSVLDSASAAEFTIELHGVGSGGGGE